MVSAWNLDPMELEKQNSTFISLKLAVSNAWMDIPIANLIPKHLNVHWLNLKLLRIVSLRNFGEESREESRGLGVEFEDFLDELPGLLQEHLELSAESKGTLDMQLNMDLGSLCLVKKLS